MVVRVVITGYGAICSLGKNTQEIWQAVLDKKKGYDFWENPGNSISTRVFGKIKFEPDLSKFSKKITKYSTVFSDLALIAADEAFTMAFGEQKKLSDYYDSHECGVIFGTGWGGFDSISANQYAYNDTQSASIQSCFHSMPSVATALISANWKLKGYQNTPIAACATGNIAIGDAYEIIKSGKAKMMIAGGAESLMKPFPIWSIDVLSALTKEKNDLEKACCPFSSNRSGFVLSEGAAVICLETLEEAEKRNATIFGEIIGYANHSDACNNLTAPAPDMEGRVMTINKAIEYSGISIYDIDYINAHGTSTPLNDYNETQVVKKVFGDYAYKIPISSTKSYTGHLIAAAGGIETIFCLKSMADNIIPATINLNNPDPECDLNYVPNEHIENAKIKYALNLNYGFGGANSCLVIKRFDE